MSKYITEISRLFFAKNFSRLKIFRKRKSFIRVMYDYLSPRINGLILVVPYLKNKYNLNILINTKDIIGWNIFFFGTYEIDTNTILEKYLKKGDVVIEAGANIGSETMLIGRICSEGMVYAFEPAPSVFNFLKFNINLNHFENVNAFQQALGEKSGIIELFLLPEDFPNQGMSSKIRHSESNKSIQVPQTTIDQFILNLMIEKLDFVKMDVQGAEFQILQGAEQSLIQFKPKILLEASDSYSDLESLFIFFKAREYYCYFIGEGAKLIELKMGNLKPGNWLCVHHEILS